MDRAYEKISPTAKFVAHLRTFSDIPFAREMAAESGAKQAFESLAQESQEPLVRFSAYWEARYKLTDRILAERGLTQVLEVAAGLSPRGLVMTENPHVVYVCTDLPRILEEEQSIVEAILSRRKERRPNLHFQIADALESGSLSKAAAAFDPGRKIAIITEGLFPYFGRQERRALAKNVHDALAEHDGEWIATDVHTRQYYDAAILLDKTGRKRRERMAASTESDLERNLFEDASDVRSFFETAGFQTEEYPYTDIVPHLSSLKNLNLSPEAAQSALELIALAKTIVLTPSHR
jgi:O-methyltransferase involved in polyketide biosynthesis